MAQDEAVSEVVATAEEEERNPAPPPPPVPPPAPPPPVPPGTKVKGTVNWFNVAKGFGALRKDFSSQVSLAFFSPPHVPCR